MPPFIQFSSKEREIENGIERQDIQKERKRIITLTCSYEYFHRQLMQCASAPTKKGRECVYVWERKKQKRVSRDAAHHLPYRGVEIQKRSCEVETKRSGFRA